MTKKQFAKIRRYCVGGRKAVFIGTAIAGLIVIALELIEGLPLLNPYTYITVIVCALLGGGLYLVGAVATKREFRRCTEQLRSRGRLEAAVADLYCGEPVYRGSFLFGKQYFAAKGYGTIFAISETDRLYLTPPREQDGYSFIYAECGGSTYSLGEASPRNIEAAKKVEEAFAERKTL